MLNMMLEEVKKHYIYNILIGCYENNQGSYKTIEKCDGVLEDIVSYEAYEGPIKRYWINLIQTVK